MVDCGLKELGEVEADVSGRSCEGRQVGVNVSEN